MVKTPPMLKFVSILGLILLISACGPSRNEQQLSDTNTQLLNRVESLELELETDRERYRDAVAQLELEKERSLELEGLLAEGHEILHQSEELQARNSALEEHLLAMDEENSISSAMSNR